MTDGEADRIITAQTAWIRENCSPVQADQANYGWFTDDVDGFIATKVYVGPDNPGGVLTTDVSLAHAWESF